LLTVQVIGVPYSIGDDRFGASRGAEVLAPDLVQALIARGRPPRVSRVDRDQPFAYSLSASRAVSLQLSRAVEASIDADALPPVIAGSCDVAMGVLAGFEHPRCGVVWIDAHGDFNTPESTGSGYLPGMSLAMVAGHCYRNVFAPIGRYQPVESSNLLLVGARDVDQGEGERLDRLEINTVRWVAGHPNRDVLDAVGQLAARVNEVYLHIDLDALDPQFAPGIVDEPTAGGLDLEQMQFIIGAVAGAFRVRAATVACFDPTRDPDGVTRGSALEILEAVAVAADPSPAGAFPR